MIPLGGIPSANLLSFSLVIFSLCYNLRFYGFIPFLCLRFPAVVRFHVIRPAQDCSLTNCAQDVPYRWSANTSDFVTIAGRLSIETSSPKLLLSLRIPQPRLADSGTRLTLTNNYCNIEKTAKGCISFSGFYHFPTQSVPLRSRSKRGFPCSQHPCAFNFFSRDCQVEKAFAIIVSQQLQLVVNSAGFQVYMKNRNVKSNGGIT